MKAGVALVRIVPLVTVLLLAAARPAASQGAYSFLCDPAYENCRTPILQLIKNETVGIDVGFWFMEDQRYVSELIARKNAGVKVRLLVDPRANAQYTLRIPAVATSAAVPVFQTHH